MNNKLFTIRKTGRMTCTWVSTGDAKAPLACVWVEAEAPEAASRAFFSKDEAGGRVSAPRRPQTHGCGRTHCRGEKKWNTVDFLMRHGPTTQTSAQKMAHRCRIGGARFESSSSSLLDFFVQLSCSSCS
jgi:hypothetical protein